MAINDKGNSELREKLAAQQHEIWAHWMQYLFSVCTENSDGTYTIPADEVRLWKHQLTTPYVELTEEDKDSDREQADKILRVIGYDKYN